MSGVEDKWGTHGDRKRNVGEKDGQETVRGGQRGKTKCPIYRECGGCQYLHLTYDQQLKEKQKRMEELLGRCLSGSSDHWNGRAVSLPQ